MVFALSATLGDGCRSITKTAEPEWGILNRFGRVKGQARLVPDASFNLGRSRVRESRSLGSAGAKAEWLSYPTIPRGGEEAAHPLPDADLMPEELRAAIVLFASLLDERQRRLFAGLESLKCGWGGDRRIASLLGIDPSTVATGRRQLVERDVEVDRVRRAGGGRTRAEKKRRKSSPASKP